MATKPQAKTAIDNAATEIKAAIDALPAGTNIKDGHISFGPTRATLILDAEGNEVAALTLYSDIQTILTNAGKTFILGRDGRRVDDSSKALIIVETKITYRIVNF